MKGVIDFDAEAVREQLKKKDIPQTGLSILLKNSPYYIKDCLQSGRINSEIADKLELINIDVNPEKNTKGENSKRKNNKADIAIDSEKLKNALKRREISPYHASKKIGMCGSYLNTYMAQEKLTKDVVKSLNSVLDIPPKEYVIGAQDEDDDRNQVNMFAPNDTLQEISDQITYLSRMIITLSTRVQGLEEALHIDRNGEV
jgi:hypothetical protein